MSFLTGIHVTYPLIMGDSHLSFLSGHIMPSTMTPSMWTEISFVRSVQQRLSLYTLFALREQYRTEREKERLMKPTKKMLHLQEKLRNDFGNLIFHYSLDIA